jgi:hypothetical protein
MLGLPQVNGKRKENIKKCSFAANHCEPSTNFEIKLRAAISCI